MEVIRRCLDIKQGIDSSLRRLNTIRGLFKAVGCSSNRQHVEVISASKTQVHGVVMTSQQAYQPKVLQRSPIETVVKET